MDYKKILSLEGHSKEITTIRYFINKKNYNYNDCLISADRDRYVIIWNIIKDYKIEYKINTYYDEYTIYSCLIIIQKYIL